MKKVLGVLLGIILLVSLVAVACGGGATTPTGDTVPKAELDKAKADLTKAQADLKTEQTKSASLKSELDALKKPVDVYRWEPATWDSAGTVWDIVNFFSEYVNAASDGRIESTPSQAGAVVTVDQQIDAVGAGQTQAMYPTAAYYVGRIPAAWSISTPLAVKNVPDTMDLYEVYKGGRFLELYYGEIEKNFNVKVVGSSYFTSPTVMASNVPILNAADVKGVKFRCGDEGFAVPLTNMGASTVWFPGSEIYTSMATNVVDAFTYGSAYDYINNSFQEVTKYWIRHPTVSATSTIELVVNRDVWNKMPEDLKALVSTAIDAAGLRADLKGLIGIDAAWVTAEKAGIQIVTWPEEDQKRWPAEQFIWAEKYASDPAAGEQLQLLKDWAAAKGYL